MGIGVLEMVLVDASELKEHDFWCGLDCLIPCLNMTKAPYVSIQFGGQEQLSCLALGEGKKEVWNEKFWFEVENNEDESEDDMSKKLVLSIIDKHWFLPDFPVGQTTIYIKDVISLGMEEGKVEYGPNKYRVVRSDRRYSGEITVAVTFIKGVGMKEILEAKSSQNLGLQNGENTCDG